METFYQKSITKLFNINKKSMIDYIKTLIIGSFIRIIFYHLVYEQREFHQLLATFLFVLFLSVILYQFQKIQDEKIRNIFFIFTIFGFLFLFIFATIFGIRNNFRLEKITSYFYKYSILVLQLISTHFIFFRELFYIALIFYLFGLFVIVYLLISNFGVLLFFDECNFAFVTGSTFMFNLINKYDYFKDFSKAVKKTDVLFEKYCNIVNNLKSSLIMINKTKFHVEVNKAFIQMIRNITFCNNDLENIFETKDNALALERYFELTKKKDFQNFLREFSYDNLFESSVKDLLNKTAKKRVFITKLYYLNVIFKTFICTGNKNERENLLKSLLEDRFFEKTENFDALGIYKIDKEYSIQPCFFEIQFRKSKISSEEEIDIIINDTTEISKIEEEKADNKYRKEYLSSVVHEFKAPINVLMLTIKDLGANLSLENNEKYKDVLNLCEYIMILIMDIICLSKNDKGFSVTFTKFPIQSPLKFSKKILDLMLKNNLSKCFSVKSEFIVDPKIETIQSDENRIKQVLINFISNAYKFTSKGTITIRVILLSSNRNFDEILVKVEDQGIGIKRENEKKLFKRFGKLEDVDKINMQGTGLGLSICMDMVSRIGNKIGYEPNINGGSIFYFSFYNVKNDELCQLVENKNGLTINEAILLLGEQNKSSIELTFESKTDRTPTIPTLPNLLCLNNEHLTSNLSLIASSDEERKFTSGLNIPDEAFSYFDDIKFEDLQSEEEELCHSPVSGTLESARRQKIVNLFFNIYKLVKIHYKSNSFMALFQNFKTYLKFFYYNLQNLHNDFVTICIVDDNSITLNSLAKQLKDVIKNRNTHIHILKAYDGVEALALYKIDYFNKRSFRYVISDQNMTMMHGIEALTLLNKFSSGNPLKLFISSSDDILKENINTKFLNFLSKPISKSELSKLIEFS